MYWKTLPDILISIVGLLLVRCLGYPSAVKMKNFYQSTEHHISKDL
jgi:hypothetical protein